jgi:hypothetical protein
MYVWHNAFICNVLLVLPFILLIIPLVSFIETTGAVSNEIVYLCGYYNCCQLFIFYLNMVCLTAVSMYQTI